MPPKTDKGNIQTIKMRNERGSITTATTEIKRIFRELHDHQLDSLGEMENILETSDLPRLNCTKWEV